MERCYFFAGQRVSSEDLNAVSGTLGSEIKNRTIDFFSKGVIGLRSDVFVLNDINNTIRIEPFISYTGSGERINMYQEIRALALDLSNPTERRLRQQGDLASENFGWETNVTYDIYISYIEKGGKPRAQVSTGVFYPTRVYTGFEFYAIRVGTDPVTSASGPEAMVRLCRLVYDGTNLFIYSSGYLQFATLDASKVYTQSNLTRTTVYNPNLPVSMADHIMCIGSGTPTPSNPHGYTAEDLGFDDTTVATHEERMHASGLTGDRSSVTSGLYIGLNYINIQQDNLILYNLTTKERLHSNGLWIESLPNIPKAGAFIQFRDGTYPNFTPLPAGVYRIGIKPADQSFLVGCDITGIETASRKVTFSSDTEGLVELFRADVVSMDTYTKSGMFDLAEFKFDPTIAPDKPISYIVNSIPRSNFITKKDLRVYGSMSAEELLTDKSGHDDVLVFPYTIQANKILLENGTEISGKPTFPQGYIQGLTLNYNTGNTVVIAAGTARDSTNSRDITLSSNLLKRVDLPWTPGGLTSAVGGLMNRAQGPELPVDGGISLHAFVIMSDTGEVDAAFDTDPNALNIRNSAAATATYRYYRRIGSLYISHNYPNTILYPFITVPMGNGVWTYYRNQMQLVEGLYVALQKKFEHTFVPGGSTFVGKFAYNTKVSPSTWNGIYTGYCPTSIVINGGGVVEMPMSTQELYTTNNWDFNNGLFCVGYYDGRMN